MTPKLGRFLESLESTVGPNEYGNFVLFTQILQRFISFKKN